MIRISVDGQEVMVPESWSDIRLADYERWMSKEPTSKLEQVELIADICSVDKNVFLDNPTQLFDVVTDLVSFVFRDFDAQPSNAIDVDGVVYSIASTNELTLAEWVDVESTLTNRPADRLTDILAIVCRPLLETYDSNKTELRKKMFEQLTMDKVIPLFTFFLLQKKRLQTASNLYSEVMEEVDHYLQLIQNFVENGDGTKSLPILQRIRYYYLMRSLKKQLSKFSHSYFTNSTKDMPMTNRVNLQPR